MANNPKATDNLRMLKKGETANPHGRPKKIINLISDAPKEEQLKIYSRMMNVLQCGSIQEARALASTYQREEYGLILQLACDALDGPNGWNALNDILDRLFGKPKIVTDNEIHPKEQGFIIRFSDTSQDNEME